jgi:predicted dehydrogenase
MRGLISLAETRVGLAWARIWALRAAVSRLGHCFWEAQDYSCRMKHLFLLPVALSLAGLTTWAAELRIGLIGLDTSHVTAFTALLNDPAAKDHVSGAKVVAAFKGGSLDIESSRSRVDGYAQELSGKWRVKLYDSIDELCRNVDAVMLESVDGRPHLEQARPVIKARKPLFIDKPMAGSLRDAVEIFRLAREAGVPVFSASSLRYGKATQAVRAGAIGKVTRARTYSPCHLEPHHPDLFWYGIHGVESLFTVMGTGCETVKRGATPEGTIEVIGTWDGGRTGTFQESPKGYGGTAWGEKGQSEVGAYDGYAPLVVEVIKFFQSGVAPVSPAETLEILAFMEAADESKQQGGAPVKIKDVMKKSGG